MPYHWKETDVWQERFSFYETYLQTLERQPSDNNHRCRWQEAENQSLCRWLTYFKKERQSCCQAG